MTIKFELHDAVVHGNFDLVDRAIRRRNDVNEQDHAGNTALYYACSIGNLDIVNQLLKAGANANIGRNQKPIEVARQYKYDAISEALLKCGAQDTKVNSTAVKTTTTAKENLPNPQPNVSPSFFDRVFSFFQ